jgi:tight adherence protein B
LKDSGINISKKYFLIILFVIALPSTYFLFKVTASLPVSIIVFSFCIFFAPKMVITHFKEKKMKDFIKYFPSTIDIIVRGVRSGLPVGECFRIIRSESPKPVCDEFGLLTDSMALGMPLEEALVDMHRRIPLAEIDYLKIVLQSRTHQDHSTQVSYKKNN